MRSPAVATELEINWIEAQWPTSWDEKYGDQALPLSALSKLSDDKNKPSLVYVVRGNEEEKQLINEDKMFGSIDVVLASRFFRCYRIVDSDITDEKIRAKYLLKKGPTVILLDAKGNEMLKNKKSVSKTWVYSKLKKQFSYDFDGKMSTHVKKLSAWLDELEKADDKKADAERLYRTAADRFEKRETPASTRSLAKAEKAYADSETTFDKIKERGPKLSSPQLKTQNTAKK
ncbi:MAG: hypothetical protein ACI97A_000509 [Planctomycetota bacterium]|jgi:hypothetical protein